MLQGIWHALFGLVAVLAVRALLPGEPAGGPLTTAALGSAGGFLAAFAGEKMGLYHADHKAGFLMAILGAVALMLIYSVFLR